MTNNKNFPKQDLQATLDRVQQYLNGTDVNPGDRDLSEAIKQTQQVVNEIRGRLKAEG